MVGGVCDLVFCGSVWVWFWNGLLMLFDFVFVGL